MLGPAVPQIHDYNPGITSSGLFWTIRVPDSAVTLDAKAGSASYAMQNVRLDDYIDLAQALVGTPATSAIASFKITWRAFGAMKHARDTANRFNVQYRLAHSKLEWTAQGGGFSFRSAPIATSAETFAMLGVERNGRYFT